MDDVTIKPLPNGPYLVTGTVRILDKSGNEVRAPSNPIALCRCGQSSSKPFCDGTHKRVGFVSEPAGSS